MCPASANINSSNTFRFLRLFLLPPSAVFVFHPFFCFQILSFSLSLRWHLIFLVYKSQRIYWWFCSSFHIFFLFHHLHHTHLFSTLSSPLHHIVPRISARYFFLLLFSHSLSFFFCLWSLTMALGNWAPMLQTVRQQWWWLLCKNAVAPREPNWTKNPFLWTALPLLFASGQLSWSSSWWSFPPLLIFFLATHLCYYH